MTTPKKHIETIRSQKFSIGGEPNSLRDDLNSAVTYLSTELYAKDVHFLMELIQNAEDNDYDEGIAPSLEFVITSKDITATGVSNTLLIFNNEKGFSSKNIESICSVGSSTKKGKRTNGYIGEKGIGFKSVFLITQRPYIFSNGYHIKFNEEPCTMCNIRYIVPEWVNDDDRIMSNIREIYGSKNCLPITTIVLPLKHDKIEAVKHQLSTIHPELLLFLTKIRKLSFKEDCEDSGLQNNTSITISSETNFHSRKNSDADSYLVHLFANGNGNVDQGLGECGYHMWRQRFPVTDEHKVDTRKEVEEWVLTLSFPVGQRLNRGLKSPGVYAFLPTDMCTNFPFIIQADFLLASSRETILMDNKWNQGILNCVPSAFVNAFCSMVKVAVEDAPISTLVSMFQFLPINESSYSMLNDVRDTIKAKLVEESVISCQSYTAQRRWNKSSEVGRLESDFQNILEKAKKQGVSLHSISSHGINILHSSFDKPEHDKVLDFLGVKKVGVEWYAKFIRDSNLVMGVSEDVYLELLLFLAQKWNLLCNTGMKDIPILKCVGYNGEISLFTINQALQDFILSLSTKFNQISWLINWNKEFISATDMYFMSASTQQSLYNFSQKKVIQDWLSTSTDVLMMDVSKYVFLWRHNIIEDNKFVISLMHFLYHSHKLGYLSDENIRELCIMVPIVDNCGVLHLNYKGILVPACSSNWVGLLGTNPWTAKGYIELSECYLTSGLFSGSSTSPNELIQFLKTYFAASDLPDMSPPDTTIPAMSGPLTKENAFLVFKWIRYLIRKAGCIPDKLLNCIRSGCWMKISLRGSTGYRPPSRSFMPSSSWANLLQNDEISILVDIPIIDERFYGDEIVEYKEELKQIGVMFEYGEACKYAGKHLMSLTAFSTLTKENVFSILKFIRFLRQNLLSPVDFIDNVKEGKWLRTSEGIRSPVVSTLLNKEWHAATKISDIPFIDRDYYGPEMLTFETELELLGVTIKFNNNYQLVSDFLKPSPCFEPDSTFLILDCIRNLESDNKIFNAVKDQKIFKTNNGYMSPSESYLLHSEWGCLQQVFDVVSLIDHEFYGNTIYSYKDVLKKIGVKVDFESVCEDFNSIFKNLASRNGISNDNVLSFLACWNKLNALGLTFSENLVRSIINVKWLRTSLGDYRMPKECILFGTGWNSISAIARLPFVNEEYYGKEIYKYRNQLKSMGVNTSRKEGYHFVFDGLSLPSDLSNVSPASVYSLLKCIRIYQLKDSPLPELLVKNLTKKWVKTTVGYRAPNEFLFFDSNWKSLERLDGPFIDEEFYGKKITSYVDEFKALGNISNITLLARHLNFHSNFDNITRIYSHLSNCNWKCGDDEMIKIWIPIGFNQGIWVDAETCVICDQDDLFGTSFNVLEKFYDKALQDFFSNAFKVRHCPSLDDYLRLWKTWEGSRETLSHEECYAFWRVIFENWTLNTEKTLTNELVKLPVYSGLSDIMLCGKEDVFIADDLELKDLFQRTCSKPLFVWYPETRTSSLPSEKLLEIYRKIGVRTISESMTKNYSGILDEDKLKEVNPREHKNFICKGLLKLILGFLGNSSMKMEPKEKLKSVTNLLNAKVFQTEEPVTINYSLCLSNGENVSATMTRMIRGDRENSKLFYQKSNGSNCKRRKLEYATNYSVTISEFLLWEHEESKNELAELIKLGSVLDFNDDAIDFLMRTKNLQLLAEDHEFLSKSFRSSLKDCRNKH
ncbi:uncharacterized protein LOC124909709 [Impatiens glandulifera]|uniref:uncharacterized protein LOC124909709 n=1 Tax=Impatiens glandulifera TaxID=253017 RepID=UPI001FB0F043|nr:uncharacterized protein LOC124909709 [Impatiens glandulifera]